MPVFFLAASLAALLVGCVALGALLLVYLVQRRALVFHYALFETAILFFLGAMVVIAVGRLMVFPNDRAIRFMAALLTSAGGILYVANGPWFFHRFLGVRLSGAVRVGSVIVNLVLGTLLVLFFVFPESNVPSSLLNLLLAGVIGYGLAISLYVYGNIAESFLRQTVRTFFVVTLLFVPYFYLDALQAHAAFLVLPPAIDDLSIPLYLLVVNALNVVVTVGYLNRPPYLSGGRCTAFFRERFSLTTTESRLIENVLVQQATEPRALAKVVPPEEVEHHLHNIFQKLGVENEAQLRQLMAANEDV